ncbi:hypothetical protein VXM60_03925 [Shewanella khirikhana]|uniref:hypothetical protein n=1 Tax=Shewanella khirikhana TaxID=1965282 RepID=UPI0030CE799B
MKRLTRMMPVMFVLGLTLPAHAGQVVVRNSDEPFDAFAVRDELARQHDWQEAIRAQQQLQILERLPVGCLLLPTPYRHFRCDGLFYRPYPWHDKELYISVPNPQQGDHPQHKNTKPARDQR